MEIITHTLGTYYGEADLLETFIITDEDGTAAELYIDSTYHMIMNIEVRDDRRGEGLARALYEAAEDALGTIYHAPAWGCTADGLAFAEAMGGEVMADETAAEITGMDLNICAA